MKILKLRFKNLNSLYGEWEIDFTTPDYNSVFAVTGPTGSGKTTILDAICLALYGRTPRLRIISNSTNNIMSIGTATCYAEVEFISIEGTFRCKWAQNRARGKAAGALQPYHHEIVCLDTGILLNNKPGEVKNITEEKTGMDFSRFCRSALLAQGRFADFLTAGAKDKSKILEQITRTHIYSDISKYVYKRYGIEKESLSRLKYEAENISLLTADQKNELELSLSEYTVKLEAVNNYIKLLQNSARWLNNITELENGLNLLLEDQEKLFDEIIKFKPFTEELEEAVKAALIEPEYHAFNLLRVGYEELLTEFNINNEKINQYETKLHEIINNFENASSLRDVAQKALDKELVLLKEVRKLDGIINELSLKTANNNSKFQELNTALENINLRQKNLYSRREQLQKQCDSSALYLNSHQFDENIDKDLPTIKYMVEELLSVKGNLFKNSAKLEEITSSVDNSANSVKAIEKLLDTAKSDHNKILSEIVNHEDKLKKMMLSANESNFLDSGFEIEKKRLSAIAVLTQYLDAEKPCPLCGSAAHPSPACDEHDIKLKIQEIELNIKEYEVTNNNLNTLKLKERKLSDRLHSFAADIALEYSAGEHLLHAQSGLVDECKELRQKYNSYKIKLEEILLTYGQFDIDHIDFAVKELENRYAIWKSHLDIVSGIDSNIKSIDAESFALEGSAIVYKENIDSICLDISVLEQEKKQVITERLRLYGEKICDDEQSRLTDELNNVTNKYYNLREELAGCRLYINTHKGILDSNQKKQDDIKPKLYAASAAFDKACFENGFTGEKDYLTKYIKKDDRIILQNRQDELNRRRDALVILIKEKHDSIVKEKGLALTALNIEEIYTELSKQENIHTDIIEQSLQIRQKIEQDKLAADKFESKINAIKKQENITAGWNRLCGLIGSADGMAFRIFAQGITLDKIISYANVQLQKMRERYILVKGDELAINVLDCELSKVERPVDNMSGGEKFIISLALALGLSKMSSRNIRIDTLFLDEGFGTLDEEAMFVALETLACVNTGGRLTGIVSHMPAVKESGLISTHIKVAPVFSGRSSIAGPGVKRLG